MITFGKSIRIYLKDGSVTGLKFGEVVNQTIQSISCPRNRISELLNYPEAKRPGIYFLFGFDEDTADTRAYIGEAENVLERITTHSTGKSFWKEVIFFVSKDENLTKSHVKYLESRAIQISKSANRYIIENSNQSNIPSLPMPDRDAMEEFLGHIRLLLGTLGHKILEEIAPRNNQTTVASEFLNENLIASAEKVVTPIIGSRSTSLSLSMSGHKAKGVLTDEGIVVLKDSDATINVQQSLAMGYRELRDKLIANAIITLNGDKYIFTKDYLFDSPSQAAAIVVGYSVNGRDAWKDIHGNSVNKIEAELLKTTNN